MIPLAIDLFCGLGGWTEGLLAEGYEVIGFDIERHEYWMPDEDHDGDGIKGTRPVAKRGITQDCAVSLGLEGTNARPRTKLLRYPAQLVLQDVLTLHGSQFKDASLIVASPPCQEFSYMAMPWSKAKELRRQYLSGERDVKKLTALFDACFRIQREACEAAGRHISLIVENVRGAQPWVGRARGRFGSYYLWGDVPALMPMTAKSIKGNGGAWFKDVATADGTYGPGNFRRGIEGATKNPGFRFDGSGRSFQPESVDHHIKNGKDWFGAGENCSLQRRAGSKSHARKAAAAMIARIPLPLARHIARTWWSDASPAKSPAAPGVNSGLERGL